MSLESHNFVAKLPKRLGLALSVVVLVLFVGGVLFGGGHKDATWSPRYDVATVCPSAVHAFGKIQRMHNELDDLGCEPPELRQGTCTSDPRPGEVQYRDCADVLVGTPTCDLEHVDLVLHGEGRGLAYIDLTRDGVAHIAHTVGHVSGLGHTTAATSYMAPRPGSEWSRIDCGAP